MNELSNLLIVSYLVRKQCGELFKGSYEHSICNLGQNVTGTPNLSLLCLLEERHPAPPGSLSLMGKVFPSFFIPGH